MTGPKPRVVFNCNVFLQAIISDKGPAWKCYQLAEHGNITLYLSPFVLYELRELPDRIRLQRFKSRTPQRIERFIADSLANAVLITEVPTVFSYPRDPDDAHYVNLALATDAQYLVTRDRDLLALMAPTRPEAQDFQNRFPTLRILNPVAFLDQIEIP